MMLKASGADSLMGILITFPSGAVSNLLAGSVRARTTFIEQILTPDHHNAQVRWESLEDDALKDFLQRYGHLDLARVPSKYKVTVDALDRPRAIKWIADPS
jgi:hypothetical protein